MHFLDVNVQSVGRQIFSLVDSMSTLSRQFARRSAMYEVSLLKLVLHQEFALSNHFCFFYSRDCPIFYMRTKVRKELQEQANIVTRFGTPSW